ncbi:MAG: rRNA ((1939)-C(5))-methyltransferase [Francisellaceae bacterium]|nr:rRNA ((1939)-C(5))-methyltransferase [Francisellaceae bacterium]
MQQNILSKKSVNHNNLITEIKSLSHDAKGVAFYEGKVLFVEGALPEETISFNYTKRKSTFDEARILETIKVSSERVDPKCLHFGVCGGCSLQHLSSKGQIFNKEKILLEQLMHLGKVKPELVLPPIQAKTWGYRKKARLGVKFVHKKNKVLIGFREKRTNKLTDIQYCEVLIPEVAKLLIPFSELLMKLNCKDSIAQIEVASGDDSVAWIIRHLSSIQPEEIKTIIEFAKCHDIQLYLQPKGLDSIHKVWPLDNVNRLKYTIKCENINIVFHPADFTQVNKEINDLMVEQALNLLELKETDTVLDLFCGIGNFTLPLAKRARFVTGIEGGLSMVERGYENANLNSIENVEFFCHDLTQPLDKLECFKRQYDKVLLDPPRSGAFEILPILGKLKPKRIVYVSCQPATLARDANYLVNVLNYKFKSVTALDMFPHTNHVEAMALFEIG